MTSKNGFGTLTIHDVKESDQGVYTCEAINARGLVFGVPDGTLTLVSNPSPGIESYRRVTTIRSFRNKPLGIIEPPIPRSFRKLPGGTLQCEWPLHTLLLCWGDQELQKHRTLP